MVKQFTSLLNIIWVAVLEQMADTGGYKEFKWHRLTCIILPKRVIDKESIGMFFSPRTSWFFTEMAIDHIVELSTTKIKKIGITSDQIQMRH
jgi:hypothetical protein